MSHLRRWWLVILPLLFMGAGCISFTSSTTAGPMGVFRSVNRGDSWLDSNLLLTAQGLRSLAGVSVYQVFNDPSDPNAMYLATRGQGLFYTYNDGDSWEMAAAPALQNKFIRSVAVDPKNKCVIYVSDGPHIYKTSDCSRSYQLVYTEGRSSEWFVSLAIDPANSRLIYGALLHGDILGSDDAGVSWHIVKQLNMTIEKLTADPFTPNRIYVAGLTAGLLRSDDAGLSWYSLNQGLSGFNDSFTFYRLVLNPNRRDSLFWVSKYGVLRSDDAGQSWHELKLITPPGTVNIYAFAVGQMNPKELYYTGTVFQTNAFGDRGSSQSTFYRSVDGGANWVTKKLPSDAIPVALRLHPTNDTLFVGFTNGQ